MIDAYTALWQRVYHRARLRGWVEALARERADKAVEKQKAEDERWSPETQEGQS